jgi:acetate kinase
MRDVLAGSERGDEACRLALDVFNHRLAREIAGMTAAVGGLDLLVLTGGIGEHAWQVRQMVAGSLSYLGVALDPETNQRATGDADISLPGAAVRTAVVTAREDIEIANQVAAVLGAGPVVDESAQDAHRRREV